MATIRIAQTAQKLPACLAPAITEETLAKYEALCQSPGDGKLLNFEAIIYEMQRLLSMVKKFFETPSSKLDAVDVPLPGTLVVADQSFRAFAVTPLEAAEVRRMDPHVPYAHELQAMGKLFDTIDNEEHKELRDAAYHLLWYGKELCLDREPLTQESQLG